MKWSLEEIEEYKNKCIKEFYGRGGNLPIDKFYEKYDAFNYIYPHDNERYKLALEPISFCLGFVEPNKNYEPFETSRGLLLAHDNNRTLICPSNHLAPILGVNIESSITGELYSLPITTFIKSISEICEGPKIVYAHGDLNEHLVAVAKESQPYIAVRELIEELIDYIGEQEFYFASEIYVYTIYEALKGTDTLLNCYLAKVRTRSK